MAAYFSGTMKAFQKGITKMSISAAVKNIEHWEEALEEVEISGVRSIIRDLGALKKGLQEDEPDGERIRHLMARLGKATAAIAEKSDNRYQDQLEELGQGLQEASEEDDDNGSDRRGSKSSSGRGQSRSSGSGSGSSSSRSGGGSSRGGQGEVKDPEHDMRLKENRDRSSSSSRSSSSQSRYDEDDRRYSSRSRDDDDSDYDRSSRHSSGSGDGRGEVRDPEHDGRLRQNRERGVHMSDDDDRGGSRSRSSRHDDDDDHRSSRGSGGSSGRYSDEPERDSEGRFTSERGSSRGRSR